MVGNDVCEATFLRIGLESTCLHRQTLGEVDGSRTHLVLIDSDPLDERDTWRPARRLNSRPLIEGQRS
jgi:hypothetical protein